jgi:hypothetical protein
LVEDESYFWTLSRYVHLNPVRGKRPLVNHPSQWAWSATVAAFFNTSPASYQLKRSTAVGRDLAACLAHRRTTPTLRELASAFGLTHPGSISNLIHRAEIAICEPKLQRQALARIEELLQKQ